MGSIKKRVKKNGEFSFTVSIRKKNQPSITKTFSKLEDAENFIDIIENPTEYDTTDDCDYPLNVLLTRYKLDHLVTKKDGTNESNFINFWDKHAGNITISKISLSVIQPIILDLKNTPTRFDRERPWDNVKKYFLHLNMCLNWCVRQQIISINPLSNIGISHLIPPTEKKVSSQSSIGGKSKEIFLKELLKVVTIEDIKRTRSKYLSKSSINYFLDSKRNTSLYILERICESLNLELGFTFKEKE